MLCSKPTSKLLFAGSKNLSQDLPDPDLYFYSAKVLNQLCVWSYVCSILKQEYIHIFIYIMRIYSVTGTLVLTYSAPTDQLIALCTGKAYAQVPATKSTHSVYATYP